MRLHDVANWANKVPLYDAYTNALFAKGQLVIAKTGSTAMSHDDRALSVAPGTVMPTRQAIKIFNDYWVVGDSNTDAYKGTPIRDNYHLERSKGLMHLLTPGEACLGSSGTTFHANLEFSQNMLTPMSDSEYDIFWNVIHSPAEAIVIGSFLRDAAGRVYRVRTDYRDQGGFQFAESYQMGPDAAQSVTFTANGGVIDPVTDAVPTISITTTALQTGLNTFYRFRTQAEGNQVAGDLTVFVAASAVTPIVGALFTMNSLKYRVITVVPEVDAWALRARLV